MCSLPHVLLPCGRLGFRFEGSAEGFDCFGGEEGVLEGGVEGGVEGGGGGAGDLDGGGGGGGCHGGLESWKTDVWAMGA